MRMYRKPGFDVLKDFAMVGRISVSDLVVIAPVDSGLRNLNDLIERARKNPGKLSFASGGIGSPAHMGAELMLSAAGCGLWILLLASTLRRRARPPTAPA
jgi:tripartite-type tricarboxylate transporter receptor subunit TctC